VLARGLAEKADPFTKKRLLESQRGTMPWRAAPGLRELRALPGSPSLLRVALIGHGRQDMKKPKPDAAAIEVECDACGGTGYPPVKEISP